MGIAINDAAQSASEVNVSFFIMLKKMLRQVLPSGIRNRLVQTQRMLVSVQEKGLALACRGFATWNPAAFRRALESAGFQVARDEDYYSPLPSVARLRRNVARWNRPSPLHGVQYDVEATKTVFGELLARDLDEFLSYRDENPMRLARSG
jgi:hypothetical protein